MTSRLVQQLSPPAPQSVMPGPPGRQLGGLTAHSGQPASPPPSVCPESSPLLDPDPDPDPELLDPEPDPLLDPEPEPLDPEPDPPPEPDPEVESFAASAPPSSPGIEGVSP
jgi:hypothetical protein